jgi:hypothetical protein
MKEIFVFDNYSDALKFYNELVQEEQNNKKIESKHDLQKRV